jgi:hypothetical protein
MSRSDLWVLVWVLAGLGTASLLAALLVVITVKGGDGPDTSAVPEEPTTEKEKEEWVPTVNTGE